MGLEDGGEEQGEPFGGITVLPSSAGLFGKGCVDEVFLQGRGRGRFPGEAIRSGFSFGFQMMSDSD